MRTQLRLTPENLPEYLENRGLVARGRGVVVTPAGDGNINWVRRVRPQDGAPPFIVKQARPTLERFPEYQVSTDRMLAEARYYETVKPFDAAGICPRVLDFDESERVLVLEDLGDVPRLDGALSGSGDPALASSVGEALGAFLGVVHANTSGRPELAARFQNDEMRGLHGDHIFVLPFRANEFPLSPTLRARAETLWRDDATIAIADAAHRDYLAPSGVLVHGDVQGGNVLLPCREARLLDAEIAHLGDGAFDLGILIAHLVVGAAAHGEASRMRPALERTYARHVAERGPDPPEFARVARYAGIELVRRTLGAARLPVVSEDAAGIRVLDLGLRWLVDPPTSAQTAV